MKLLHIVPHHFAAEGYADHGSTKDIMGRREYLLDRGIESRLVRFNRKAGDIAETLAPHALDDFTHVLVDASVDEPVWAHLRQAWPHARLALRSHNSEIPHRRDAVRALRGWPSSKKLQRALRNNIGVFGRRDIAAAKLADCVLTIEPGAGVERYWRRLGFDGDVIYSPYFMASDFVRTLRGAQDVESRSQRSILCVLSVHPGPLTDDNLIRFMQLRRSAGSAGEGWTFEAVGEVSRNVVEHPKFSPEVSTLGVVDDLAGRLRRSSAVAVLSDYGRGFKTKILEAIACGAWVLVSGRLRTRLPEDVLPFCIPVDVEDPDSIRYALDQIRSTPPTLDPNPPLKAKAYAALDRFLC